MVMHSAGGFLGYAAVEGLGKEERVRIGERGGVRKMVFLAAGIADVGHKHVDMPFMDLEVSLLYHSLLTGMGYAGRDNACI